MRIKSFLFSTLALAAGLLTIYSCTAELEQYPQRGPVTEEADFLVITENPVTKTVFDGEHTLWAENDKISAINIEDGGDEYYASSMTYRGDNRFGGRVTYAGDVNNWYLIYPYRADNVTPKETHIHIPEVQVQNGNDDMSHIAGEGFPLIGKELGVSRNNQLQVTMRNVLARLDFKVTNTAGSAMVFKQVVFTAPDNVCGDFVGDITNDSPSWTAQPDAFKSLTLNIENGTPVANGELAQFHAGIAPLRIPANGSIKAKVVAVSPSAPENEIVFYHIFNITNGTTLRSGTSYGFNMSFDTAHSVDPTPDEPIIENQVISFDQENVTWQLGAGYYQGSSYDVQAVNGAHTAVTYTSSNTNVATIDESNSRITIVGAGTTTITANAVAGNGYNAASAYYELTIVAASTGGEAAYVKVTRDLGNWDGTYLFVDETSGKAFAAFSGNADSYAVNVTISNGRIVSNSTVDRYALTVTDAGVKHANATSLEAYNIRNSEGKYIFWSSSTLQILDTNQKVSGNSSSSTLYTYYNTLEYFEDGFRVMSSGHSSGFTKYYFGYYSSAFRYYSTSDNSSATSSRIALYKLESGSGSISDKQDQHLSFSSPEVTWSLDNGYPAGSTHNVQAVSGAHTNVTYVSSKTNVATIDGTTITIVGKGSTTITANAAEDGNYNAASASYTLNITSDAAPAGTVYVKATSFTPGTYLITDIADQRLFKGDSNGSYVSVSPVNGVITDSSNSLSGYEFEITESNGKYIITFNDQYLICDYSNSGNSNTGLTYLTQRPSDTYLYTLSVNDGRFEFKTAQRNSSSTNEVLYFKSANDLFKIGGSGVGVGVHLYLKGSSSNPALLDQNLSFAQSSVTATMATASGTMAIQQVSGAQTFVSYTSSNTNVARVSGTNLIIEGFGTTTITANAVESSVYNSASAAYTLTIAQSGSVTPTGARTYTYVAPGSLQPGTYLIAGSETNELSVALFPTVNTASWNSQTTGQVNNGQFVPHKVVGSNNSVSSFTTEDADIIASEVELAKSGNNWTIQVKSTGQYLVVPSQEYRVSYVNSTSATAFQISNGTSGASVTSGSYYFYHSGSAGGFTFRTTSTSNIRFYQYTSGGTTPTPGKQDQSLSFANGTVNWTLGSGYTVGQSYDPQSVNGAQTTVTYSIADSYSSVAQIVSGRIKINGAGTATVTATAQANDTYNSATSSYTLNILPESGVMVYNLENDRLKGYLDRVEANPYDPENYSYTYMTSEFYGGWNEMNKDNRYDIPKPVPVSWSNPTSSNGTKVVYIYNDSAMTDLELSVTDISSSATSADVYNLIPGRMYYYKVTNSGSNWTSTGQFMTTGRRRMMKVGNDYGNNYANNCRDFGGQVTTSGKKIKYGKIYRGSNMDSTSGDARTFLKGYMNIGLDLDLRSTYEHRNPLGVTCPDPGYNGWGTGDNGLRNVTNMQTTLNAVFDAVQAGKGVYIHCAIGADRTGYVCMLLEAILGVSQGNCDVDYEITSLSCVGTKTRTGTGNYYYLSSGNEKRGVDYVNTYNGNTFQEKAIDCLVTYYGISMQTITAFQNAMLE